MTRVGTVWRHKAAPELLLRINDEDEYWVRGREAPQTPGKAGDRVDLPQDQFERDWEPASLEEWERAMAAAAPPARPEVAPDLVGAVFSYRVWQMDPLGNLWSFGMGETLWEPGVNTALCNKPGTVGHRPPLANCACGFYAYHDPINLEVVNAIGKDFIPVVGVTRMWGDMEVHRDGVRSEFAEVAAIGYPLDFSKRAAPALPDSPAVAAFEKALERYGAEPVPSTPDDLRHWIDARQDGGIIPKGMRPSGTVREPIMFWADEKPVAIGRDGTVYVRGELLAYNQSAGMVRGNQEDLLLDRKVGKKHGGHRLRIKGKGLFDGEEEAVPAICELRLNSRIMWLAVRFGASIDRFFIGMFILLAAFEFFSAARNVIGGDYLTAGILAAFATYMLYSAWRTRRQAARRQIPKAPA